MAFNMRRTEFRLLVLFGTFCLLLVICKCNSCSDSKVFYDTSTDCEGKKGTDFILSSINTASRVECVERCEKTFKCMLFFYNMVTGTCSLHSRMLPDITMTDEIDTSCFFISNPAESWITEITSVSESASGNPASNMIGPSDADYWAQSDSNKNAYITVVIASDMYIERMTIYETTAPGGVEEIKFADPDGSWYLVWSTPFLPIFTGPKSFEPNLQMAHIKTSKIRFNIGVRALPETIDAVKVTGRYVVSKNRAPAS